MGHPEIQNVLGTKHIDFVIQLWSELRMIKVTKGVMVLLRNIPFFMCAYLDCGHEKQVSLSLRCSFTSHEVSVSIGNNPFTC